MRTPDNNQSLVTHETIAQAILFFRGQKVILDEDLASLYGVETRILVRNVKRNLERFPHDFMFQLTHDEFGLLTQRRQYPDGRGGRRYVRCFFSTWTKSTFFSCTIYGKGADYGHQARVEAAS
jgi:hypothetical protein